MAYMVTAGRQCVLLPSRLGGIDTIVRGNHANPVIYCHTQQSNRLSPTYQPPQIIQKQQVGFSRPKFCLNPNELRTVKSLTFAFGRDHAVLHRPVLKVGHDLLGMVNLIFK